MENLEDTRLEELITWLDEKIAMWEKSYTRAMSVGNAADGLIANATFGTLNVVKQKVIEIRDGEDSEEL